MTAQRRSAREIMEELKDLAATSDMQRDRVSLLHEVHVYQEELTVQNEELIRAQAALEETRDRFIDLYDFAPNTYLTLDPHGIILQINLTGAAMFGKRRDVIEGMPLLGYIVASERPRLLDFLRVCRTADRRDVVAELTINTHNGERDVQLICRPRRAAKNVSQEFFTAILDVTEHRLLEAERETAAREQAALTARLINVQDAERHRIARDLHDNFGQQVTALRLVLDSVAGAVGDDAARSRVAQAQTIVGQLDKQLDFLTSELRPVALDLGAISAIGQFVNEWSNTFGIPAKLHCSGFEDLRLKPDVETHMYRVVQEGLNNIAKHAQARHVNVRLTRRGSLLVLTIADDGCGFDVSARARARARAQQHLGTGLGLVGMRERALLINGTLDVHSSPGNGTTITLQIPAASSGP